MPAVTNLESLNTEVIEVRLQTRDGVLTQTTPDATAAETLALLPITPKKRFRVEIR